MNTSLTQSTWLGQKAWIMENDTLRTVVVPDLGAKLVSLFDKRTGNEWLVGAGERPFQKIPYAANFTEQDMSGWDEMFPTITACEYPVPGEKQGVLLPDHGEVWPLPWTLEPSKLGTLKFSVQGVALPYRLTRTLSYSTEDTLHMAYQLENLGQESMPYLWSAHPQFTCGDSARVILPAHVQEVCNVLPPEWGWGALETRHAWPTSTTKEDQHNQLDLIETAAQNQIRKFFVLPDTVVSWTGLIRQPAHDWLRFDWDAGLVPYLGIWMDEGVISSQTVVALEPMTGFYDSLALAWENKQVTTITPGEHKSWTLSIRLGTNDQPFPSDF